MTIREKSEIRAGFTRLSGSRGTHETSSKSVSPRHALSFSEDMFMRVTEAAQTLTEMSTAMSTETSTKQLTRADSLADMLQQKTGHPAMPERLPGDRTPVLTRHARWLSNKPAVLASGGELYLQSALVLGKGSSGVVSLGLIVGTGALVAMKRVKLTRSAAGRAQNIASALSDAGSTMAPHQILRTDSSAYFIESLNTLDMFHLDASLNTRTRHGLAWLMLEGVVPQLAQLHANGQAHCDIKPSNIMQRASQLRLIDYDFVEAKDANKYGTTPWYAPPETVGLQQGAGLDKLDSWCLGASLWAAASGFDATDILSASKEAFDGQDWRTLYTGMYPYLKSRRKPTLNYLEEWVWSGFENLQPFMRSVVLGLMNPHPNLRLDPEVAQNFLLGPEALAECDVDAARNYLRARAQARTNAFVPAIRAGTEQLRSRRDMVEAYLGSVPAWLDSKR